MAHVLKDLSTFGLAMVVAKVRKATFYVNDKLVVKMTARFKPRKNCRTLDYVVTIGHPNYAERKYIKQCAKAGVKLPTRKGPLFKHWPERKRAKRAKTSR